ncbi:MAG: LysR family transcriptional regulator [Amphritea sp.]
MDRLTAMRIFVRVVQTESFSAVAEEMRISQSSVSKKISALESYIGSRLLTRSSRKIMLSEVGSGYYEHCLSILADVEKAEVQAKGLTADPAGTLRISIPTIFGRLYIVPHISRFMDTYPNIKVDMKLLDSRVDLVGEGIDVAIRIGQLADSTLVARTLGVAYRTLVASDEYLKRHGTPQHPSELRQHNCLVYSLLSTQNDWHFIEKGKEITVQVDGYFQANSGDVVQQMVLADQGIAFLPRWLVQEDIDAGRMLEVLPEYAPDAMPINAIYPHNRYTPLKVSCFIDFIQALFQDKDVLQRRG